MTTAEDFIGSTARCAGRNHRDVGTVKRCSRCNAWVVKTEAGKTFVAGETSRGISYVCWNPHHCDPETVRLVEISNATRIASGEILKGARVTVVKGRKVPVGTTGIVIWTGKDSYDNERVGIKDADGTTHWTAKSNVELVEH